MVKDTPMSMVRGDTHYINVVMVGLSGNLDSAYFSVKENEDDDTYVFQKTLSDGIEKITADTYQVRIAPEDTASIEKGTYHYDLQIEKDSDVFTPLIGPLYIRQDITEASE